MRLKLSFLSSIILFPLLFSAFSACGISSVRFVRINKNMAPNEVKQIIGNPADKKLKDNQEIWYYTIYTDHGDRAKYVMFIDDKVSEIGDDSERQALLNIRPRVEYSTTYIQDRYADRYTDSFYDR